MDPARSPEVVCRLAALCNIEMFVWRCALDWAREHGQSTAIRAPSASSGGG
jgi:hypothetical protein